jgi:hypothetical protein
MRAAILRKRRFLGQPTDPAFGGSDDKLCDTDWAVFGGDGFRKEPSRCAAPAKMLLCLPQRAGGNMSDQAVEILITNAIHSAFIKYPEGDGGPNLDYEWIAPDQSAHIAKAILLELSANGYQIAKKGV